MIQFSGAKNDYGWMSNFYRCDIKYKGLIYKSSEAAWQAQKTLDEEVRKTFQFMTPAESKRAGRKVTLRPDWESVKYSIMVDVLTAKFRQNVQLLNWLMLTGEEQLLENTTGWHDNTWGDCSCPKCKNITGQNLLGKALMEVRANFAPVEKFDLLVCYDELHPREEIIKDVSNFGVVDNTYYYIKDGKRHVITDRLLVFGRADFFKE